MAKSGNDAVISLFCGAGGLSLGFRQAGIAPAIAAEIDDDACASYCCNVGSNVLNVDLSQQNEEFLAEINRYEEPFAIIGGPPCQGFSSAGQKDHRDPRNQLVLRYLRLVEHLRPRWFLFENVEGLLTSNNGQSLANLVCEFIRIGYRVRLEKVNFAAFGLPQTRKRVIIVGNRLGLDFTLPLVTHSFNSGKHKSTSSLPLAATLSEALAGLGEAAPRSCGRVAYKQTEPVNWYDALMRDGNRSPTVSLHNLMPLSKRVQAILPELKPGDTMRDLPEELWHESFKRRAFRRVMDGTPTERRGGAPSGLKRLRGDLNALTITGAATREFIHPDHNRSLTLRESARLQSFPDKFEFKGALQSIASQIGNAFPPIVARVFANHLLQLDGSFGATLGRVPVQTGGALIGFHLTDAMAMSPALANANALLSSLRQGSFRFSLVPEVVE